MAMIQPEVVIVSLSSEVLKVGPVQRLDTLKAEGSPMNWLIMFYFVTPFIPSSSSSLLKFLSKFIISYLRAHATVASKQIC